jgi:hypothetical protein
LGGPNGERDLEDCEGGPDDPLHPVLRKVRNVRCNTYQAHVIKPTPGGGKEVHTGIMSADMYLSATPATKKMIVDARYHFRSLLALLVP